MPNAVKAEPFGNCPECGVAIAVPVDEQGRPVAIIHVAPTCVVFDGMEADVYFDHVMTVREALRMPTVSE